MSEPLDFSSTGIRTPAPPAAPKPPRLGTGRPKAVVAVVALAAVAVVALGGYLAFGRDSGGGAGTATTVARYCDLASQFDAALASAVEGGRPAGETPVQVEAFADELEATAPGPIRGDVAATVEAVKEAAGGNTAALRSASYQERQARIAGYRQKVCGAGAGSGDQ